MESFSFSIGEISGNEDKSEYFDKLWDVIVLGGGPAGLTAALYAVRYGLDTLVVEKAGAGGQVAITDMVENYPGFPEGIGGAELANRIRKQAEKFGAKILIKDVRSVKLRETPKEVEVLGGTIKSKTTIIATGADFRKLGVPGEGKFTGRGVSYCATCDAPLFRNKPVAVVGGGDTAVEEALYITKYASKVYLIHRRDALRAARVYQERAFANPKIEILWSHIVQSINGEEKVNSITLENLKTGEKWDLEVDGVFIFIGLVPNTRQFRDQVKTDEAGYIITNEDMKTSVEGVFAAGDVRRKSLRQVVTAVADGAIAATSAYRYIENI